MKILIVGPSWVGDMVMAQSLFRSIKTRHGEVTIDVLAPPWCQALLDRMPEVGQVLPFAIGHGELGLGKRYALGKRLRTAGYTQAIVLPNSFKSALVPLFARIGLRTGWRGEARNLLLNDCRRLDKVVYPLMVERFAALAWPAGSALPRPVPRPHLVVDPAATASVREKFGLAAQGRILVLCPGAEYGPAKQWPERHYAETSGHFLAQGWQVWLLGSARDEPVGAAIRHQLPAALQQACINLCGRTNLGEAADLMAAATAVVSNDSGLMHVAAALARPLVVVYGSTSAAFTPPLAEQVTTLSLNLPCSPCFKRQCPLGHLDCLQKLPAAKAIAAVTALVTA